MGAYARSRNRGRAIRARDLVPLLCELHTHKLRSVIPFSLLKLPIEPHILRAESAAWAKPHFLAYRYGSRIVGAPQNEDVASETAPVALLTVETMPTLLSCPCSVSADPTSTPPRPLPASACRSRDTCRLQGAITATSLRLTPPPLTPPKLVPKTACV